MKPSDSPQYVVLRQIADALGVPIERFLAGRSSCEGPDGVAECLNLWLRIRTAAGRQSALDHLRAIIEDEGRD